MHEDRCKALQQERRALHYTKKYMREIEIKARVADKLQLLHILKSQDVALSDPITQRDQVFGIAGVDGGTYHVTDGYDVLMRKSLGREG
jgi:hypothetical protein